MLGGGREGGLDGVQPIVQVSEVLQQRDVLWDGPAGEMESVSVRERGDIMYR